MLAKPAENLTGCHRLNTQGRITSPTRKGRINVAVVPTSVASNKLTLEISDPSGNKCLQRNARTQKVASVIKISSGT